ncbi:hypothetical protein F7725_010696 [Dissostichus mawsoni]|uniref:Uncharacterized protein n=1 Tax=Dissostichus mawsoni TaxID=36200 RepID=A0A7J5XS58_DISMA|nr:hypothetical protein F7725_010696 [Dissostichus mawsoni]
MACLQCFVEMEKAEEAERMAEDCKENPPKHQCPSRSKRESSGSSPQASRSPEEPAAKKPREEEEEEEEKLEERRRNWRN